MATKYHMRRADKEIKDRKKLEMILKETNFVTVALARDNDPYLVSLSHSYDEEAGCLYFHCASEGKKLDYMRSNPRVWGQALIDHGYSEGQCSHLYVSAMFRGRVEFIDDLEEKRRIMRHMILHQDSAPETITGRLTGVEGSTSLERTAVGRIAIEELTGKKSAEIDF